VMSKPTTPKIPSIEPGGEDNHEGAQMLGLGFSMTAPDHLQPGGYVDPESLLSADELMADGRRNMKATEQSVLRSARVVDEALAISRGTAVMLQEQSEQLGAVVEDLTLIRFNLGKANNLMRGIARRIATDKCIMFLMVLLVGGIVALIVLQATGVKLKGSSPPSPPGSSPPPSSRRRMLLHRVEQRHAFAHAY